MAVVGALVLTLLHLQLSEEARENVALSKPAWMSSINNAAYPAENAVDGNTSTTVPNIIHTKINEPSAWWIVDLQREVQDPLVRVYFRTDNIWRRMYSLFYTSSTNFTEHPQGDLCNTVSSNSMATVERRCSGTWRYLMIYRNQYVSWDPMVLLDFAEVEVIICTGNTYGDICDKPCSSRQCVDTSAPCPPADGVCSGGCAAGWTGTDCTMECSNNKYGPNCTNSCSSRHCAVQSSSCDRVTGACVPSGCQAGYQGINCTQECSNNIYGLNCTKSCSFRHCAVQSSSCDHVTGACVPSGCQAGYHGPDCTQECSSNKYGPNCATSCSSRPCAEQSSSCDHVTGACGPAGCQSGYQGTDCTQECSNNKYGLNCAQLCSSRHCAVQASSCDNVNGTCGPAGCQVGFQGTDCTQVCSTGYYGTDCQRQCVDRKCVKSSNICDHVTGVCPGDCAPGWNGTDCLEECAVSTRYGPNCEMRCSERNCVTNTSDCDQESGRCPQGCADGWRGDDCTNKCPEDTFGATCIPCNTRHCFDMSSCPVNGTCSGGCLDGWILDTCTKKCGQGRYGNGCSINCGNCTGDDSCDHMDGSCPNGCDPGWEGSLCQTASVQSPPNNPPVIPAVAGVVAALLVIVVIVVIVCVVRRRRRAASEGAVKKTENGASLGLTNTSQKGSKTKDRNGDANVYVNVEPPGISDEKKNGRSVGENPKPEKVSSKPQEVEHKQDKGGNKPQTSPKPVKTDDDTDVDEDEETIDDNVDAGTSDYYNDTGEEVIREVSVGDLEDIIQRVKRRKEGFGSDYNRLPSGFTDTYDDSQRPENAKKNRFRGYYPYDHNRVRLSPIPDVLGSDYINASIVHSYDKKRTYIASQAPNKYTYGDFIRMIWEQGCRRIVMLTGLEEQNKVKCYQYWPKADETDLQTDHFLVKVVDTDIRANYTIRYISIKSKETEESRSFVQYHYTSWPDHGVPDTLALVNFIWMMRKTGRHGEGPLLVHCSAGIGRTGTYIAVDSLLDQAQEEGVVDVPGYVCTMREQRKNMIQTKEQYECVFHCLLEITKFGNTSMGVENFTNSYRSRGMDSVVDRKTRRELAQIVVDDKPSGDPNKHRVWIDGNQNFLVMVAASVRNLLGYLQTVTPAKGQEKLLWKLVEENNVHNIIVISALETPLWGETGKAKMYGDVTVTTGEQTQLDSGVILNKMKLKPRNSRTESISVYQLTTPPTVDDLCSTLINNSHLQDLCEDVNPVIIVHSPAERKSAAMLCMMGNILCGVLQDRAVDVIGHVRRFYKSSPGLQLNQGDVEQLHAFAQEYVEKTESSSTYANL